MLSIRCYFNVFVICIFSGSFNLAYGQYANYTSLTDVSGFASRYKVYSAKLQTISSDFEQEKDLSALAEKMKSVGKFSFKRTNKVRIEYEKPFRYLMIMNGDKLWLKDDQKVNQVNVRSNKLLQQVNRIIIDCIQGSIMDSQEFTARVFENSNTFLLEMTPVSKSLKGFFTTIVLVLDKQDYSVNEIRMNEPGGDSTTMLFSNKTINAVIADEVFIL